MDWQAKIKRLMGAVSKHPTLGIGFDYNEPMNKEQLDFWAKQLRLPNTLEELYQLCDGMIIGVHFVFPGIITSRFGLTLEAVNDTFLESVQHSNQHLLLEMIICTDNATGDLLCLNKAGQVFGVSVRGTQRSSMVANSIDEFIDNVCLGEGYIQYFRPTTDNFWVPVLQEFNFINSE